MTHQMVYLTFLVAGLGVFVMPFLVHLAILYDSRGNGEVENGRRFSFGLSLLYSGSLFIAFCLFFMAAVVASAALGF